MLSKHNISVIAKRWHSSTKSIACLGYGVDAHLKGNEFDFEMWLAKTGDRPSKSGVTLPGDCQSPAIAQSSH